MKPLYGGFDTATPTACQRPSLESGDCDNLLVDAEVETPRHLVILLTAECHRLRPDSDSPATPTSTPQSPGTLKAADVSYLAAHAHPDRDDLDTARALDYLQLADAVLYALRNQPTCYALTLAACRTR